MQNLFIDIQGRVILVVRKGGAFPPVEWRSILALAAREDLAELRFLVYDEGGTIGAAQRSELIETMNGRMPMAAVMTDSPVSRGIVTAIGWFKPGIKAFQPRDFDKAARYLGLTEKEGALARETADERQRQLARKTA